MFDDRPDFAQRLEKARIARGFESARAASEYFGWKYDTYAQHENGTRGITRAAEKYAKAFRVSEAWLLTGEGIGPDGEVREATVPVMGFLGAGAEVEPDFEQVPPEGLFDITVPFDLPGELIAFEVRGDSMRPVYRNGHIIIVYREQRRPLEYFYGQEAAVRTSDGRRFIKTIMRGVEDTVTLSSWNADPIEGQRLDWIGEIFATLPPSAVRHLARHNDNRKTG